MGVVSWDTRGFLKNAGELVQSVGEKFLPTHLTAVDITSVYEGACSF